jgi:hypothetical protein
MLHVSDYSDYSNYNNHNQSNSYQYQCMCLWLEEPVLMMFMIDGSYVLIKDAAMGNRTQFVRTTEKQIYEVTTLCGRKIRATGDHKFMTRNGWTEVKDLIPFKTQIGIYDGVKDLINGPYKNHVVFMSVESIIEVPNCQYYGQIELH